MQLFLIVLQYGSTALHAAASEGGPDLALALLDRGAAIDAADTVLKLAALIYYSFPVLSVAILLQSGETALHAAVTKGHLDLARVLLDKGAAIDAVNNVFSFHLF